MQFRKAEVRVNAHEKSSHGRGSFFWGVYTLLCEDRTMALARAQSIWAISGAFRTMSNLSRENNMDPAWGCCSLAQPANGSQDGML